MDSVLILDDDAMVRERLRRLLARAVPHARALEADSLKAAGALLAGHRIDTALIDVGLPDGSGLTLLPMLQGRTPPVDAIVVTSLGDDATVLEALRGGAVGYLLKNASDVEIELSLRSIERGGAPIDPVIARRVLTIMAAPAPIVTMRFGAASPSVLSPREMDVLGLVSQGHSNREIAEQLHLSINTVECHAKSIYRKLAVRSRAGAVYTAREQGLLP
ncbi:MAG: response regulator transcription factor [Proteobacteria bacterium]|nr:response regulator transcription factor [Pseudomonadota bacterium]